MGVVAYVLGPLAAVIGIGAVYFVLRHRSVQTKSMYSSRRGQIERKVREQSGTVASALMASPMEGEEAEAAD